MGLFLHLGVRGGMLDALTDDPPSPKAMEGRLITDH